MEPDVIERNRRQQAELYGAALGDLVLQARTSLGLTQRRVAEVLGLSTAMLSQLINAQRVKIGNPAVVSRLTALLELAGTDPAPSEAEVEKRLTEISQASGAFTHTTRRGLSDEVRRALLATGSAAQLRASADLVEAAQPKLAELLRRVAVDG